MKIFSLKNNPLYDICVNDSRMVMLATKHVYAFSQVVSVYAEPDIVELNYHAGTACRTVA